MDRVDRDRRIQTICLTVLTIIAVGFVLYWLQRVLVPFVLAIFVSVGLAPLIDVQIRHLRMPRAVAVVLAVALAVGFLTLAGVVASVSLARLVDNAALYQQQLRILFEETLARLPLAKLGVDPSVLEPRIPAQAIGSALVGTGNALIATLTNGVLVIVFVIFLLVGRYRSDRRLGGAWGEIESRVKRYIVVKVLVSLATASSVGAVLALLGVPLAAMFAMLTFLLNFIPSLGSIIATLLPLPVVLVDPTMSTMSAVMAIAIPGAIQLAFGNFIEPKIYGESLDVHPIVTLMSLVLWGTLWGVVGMFLAAPMAAVVKILFARLDYMEPFADAMGGRLEGLFEHHED